MVELTTAAQRKLDRHLARIRTVLARAGHHREEIDAASFGVQEQVHDLLEARPGSGPVGPDDLDSTLALIEAPDEWSKAGGQGGTFAVWSGWLALALAVLSALGAAFSGVIASQIDGDGGAILSSILLFGAGGALALGLMGRRNRAGRAALGLVAVLVAAFLVALAVAGFGL